MVIVDTTVWIDFLHGMPNDESLWLRSSAGIVPIGLTDLTLCEVLQGVRDENDFSAVLNDLLLFHVFETGGADLAISAAKNYRLLRSHGHTVRKTVDCIIATFCLRNSYTLLHRDKDFDPFERILNLSVMHP